MTKSTKASALSDKSRIDELERRVKELEQRPQWVPVYVPQPQPVIIEQPYYPTYPQPWATYTTCSGASIQA